MPQNNQTAARGSYVFGERVSSADFIRDMAALRSAIGKAVAAQQGTPNAVPPASAIIAPLAVTTNGTMSVTIGGGQVALIDGYICDACPQMTFTVPPSGGTTRVDLIAVQYAVVIVGTETETVEDPSGNQTQVQQNIVADGCAYQYVQGDGSGNAPTAPSGYDAFATITVPASATGIVASNVAILFPTLNPQGIQGLRGLTGPQGPYFNPRNAWQQGATYNALDVVAYGGGSWVVNSGQPNTTGTPPAQPIWTQVAAAGIPGTNGANGQNGSNGANGANGRDGATGPIGPTPWTTTTQAVVIPAPLASLSVPVVRPDAFPNGTYVTLGDNQGHSLYGYIAQGGNPISITVVRVTAGGVGSTMLAPATLTFSGPPGQNGVNGTNGRDGTNGTNGTNGVNGVSPPPTPGIKGDKGDKGDPGASAQPFNGSAGSSLSSAFAAGVVPLTKRVNYGTAETGRSSSGDDAYPGPSSYLGAHTTVGAFGGPQTIEEQVRITVKRGAGAQTLGGALLTSGVAKVYVDATLAYSSGPTNLSQQWSASIPDDGATHTVYLHVSSNANGQIFSDWGRWIAADGSGGIDGTRFSYVGD